MHLQRLEIHGFKSFAQKSVLEFLPPRQGRKGLTAIVGPNGSGKCVDKDTRVHLSTGKLVRIKDLFDRTKGKSNQLRQDADGEYIDDNPEKIKILSLNPRTLTIENKPIQCFIKRKAPDFLLKITTNIGQEIISTHYHPFFTLKEGVLRTLKASEITPGASVAMARVLPVKGYDADISLTKIMDKFEKGDNVYLPYSLNLVSYLRAGAARFGSLAAFARKAGFDYKILRSVFGKQAINICFFSRLFKIFPAKEIGQELKSKGDGFLKLPDKLTPELARFLGYLISEGRVNKNSQVWFVNNDSAMVDDFCRVTRNLFNLEAKKFHYKKNAVDVIIFSKTLSLYLERVFDIKIAGNSFEKQVPEFILSASRRVVANFLGALFSGDGYVCSKYNQNTRKHTDYVEYATASKKLANDVVYLLLRLGVVSRIQQKIKFASNTVNKKKRRYYFVYIYGLGNIKKFLKQVDLIGEKRVVASVVKKLKYSSNPNRDLVPGINHLFKILVKESGISVKKNRGACPKLAAYYENTCEASREGVVEAVNFIKRQGCLSGKANSLSEQLLCFAAADIFWSKVEKVEKIRKEEWVYDLTVAENHNFIANNFFVHNSNVSDAVRWVLGEQSLKTLRGKKSEDVIFAGSEKRARLGVAEVSLTLNNEDKEAPWEMSEAMITRRLYRDGESEYLINGHAARLQDIAMLLARARFGQKTYTVIGQGMIDAILAVSPAERKEFFDEAAGVKEFQIKRHQAVSKLNIAQENLTQAEALLQEIEPRLRSLNRQVKRLNERAEVEKELKELQKQYYGKLWHDLAEKHGSFSGQFHRQDEEFQRKKGEYNQLLDQLNLLEKETPVPQAFLDLEKKYQEVLSERNNRQEKKLKLQSQIEIAKIRASAIKTSAPLLVTEIIKELEDLEAEQDTAFEAIFKIKKIEELFALRETTDLLREKIKNLLRRLKNPQTQSAAKAIDPELEKGLSKIDEEMKNLSAALARVSQEMQDLNKEEQKKKSKFFEIQRQLQAKQEETHILEQKLNSIQIELAKLETRKETLEEEINIELGPLGSEVKLKPPTAIEQINPADLQPQIFKLKHQLELIGGIDEEAIAEHKETKERYDFLSTQIADLKRALTDTVTVIEELDNIMRERRNESLKKINEEFSKFFRLLFNGGQAKLVPLYSEAGEDGADEEEEMSLRGGEVDEAISMRSPRADKSAIAMTSKGEPLLAGVDIQATPPGKRIKDINVLSGGERALTSVALLCAILSHSPSPFVFLDEVDAALDESNSIRFAEIIERLSEKTQIIIITHNRASMAKAQVLYGVTMGDDGTSRLLSVKLAEAEKIARE